MSDRRTFLKKVSLIGVGSQLVGDCLNEKYSNSKWENIASKFLKNSDNLLNLNTGSAGIMPEPILANYLSNVRELCSYAPYEIKERHLNSINNSITRLSNILDVEEEELTYVRNTTEGLCAILNNYPFEAGDEIIISKAAYPYPHNTIDRLVLTKGIKKVQIDFDPFDDTDSVIASKFSQAITSRTKLILATYILHREGNILPIQKICADAHNQGVEVLVDAAHALGQIEHRISDLTCDYYVTSLHKWMHAPLGTGLLYIKKDHIEKIDPGYPSPPQKKLLISKFDYTGTIAFQNSMSMETVLDFYDEVGISAKQNRIRALAIYLEEGLKDISTVDLRSDLSRSCGIMALKVNGSLKANIKTYEEKYGIHLKSAGYRGAPGFFRISLNLHLLEADLDRFILATKNIFN